MKTFALAAIVAVISAQDTRDDKEVYPCDITADCQEPATLEAMAEIYGADATVVCATFMGMSGGIAYS